MFDVGRLCIKIAGREEGKHCVVIGKVKEDGFVLVTGPKAATGVRRRRCNVAHLKPLEDMIDIKADASDEEIMKVYEKMNFYEKFGVRERKPFEAKRERKGPKAETKPAEKKAEPKPAEKVQPKSEKPPVKKAEPKAAAKPVKAAK